MSLEEKIKEKLKTIIDPHTGVDIVTMGLVRDIKVEDEKAKIVFVPTTPFCPIVGMFQQQIKQLAESVEGIKEAEVSVETGECE